MRAGNEAAVQWLLAEGAPKEPVDVLSQVFGAAMAGDVATLEFMMQAGPAYVRDAFFSQMLAHRAAIGGHAHVLEWMWHEYGWSAESHGVTAELLSAACTAGSFEILAWARERLGTGAAVWRELQPDHWGMLALTGSVAGVELLAELGLPKPVDGSPFVRVVLHTGHRHAWWMLPALHRLGVPFGPACGELLAACVACGAPLGTLRWLLAAGCPVDDWSEVEQALGRRRPGAGAREVQAWVREQREGQGPPSDVRPRQSS
ncbi:hypothetical protein HYH03_001658 [Edaphochlamys debaryana]|uniref:Ankyrin repeat domain-containing protein n=1 Tax=Edaphochlamys debaryana TaxID=47281 RepID=A0A835YND6_9CHLO|nr:hypothetical protein HYH03_001658 [Edaphochlamys debaryana]|eukprot:KAG2500899.1 hypothetical protein HYH03_001658 [Edaphochlamys debaryana]